MLSDFNGKVVLINKFLINQAIYPEVTSNETMGIAFASTDDLGRFSDCYVHLLFSNDGIDLHFMRFPIDSLSLSNKKVSTILKEAAIDKINDYYNYGYLDNLTYVETLYNVQRIETL